jgi:hypothetical protein
MGLVKKYFTASGSWVCPAGVTNVILVGAGGGGGGGNGGTGSTEWAGGGGGGSIEQVSYVDVVPNTSYTITIGAGGAAATVGGNTSFGSLCTFYGANRGYGQSNCWVGGNNTGSLYAYVPWATGFTTSGYIPSWQTPGMGGMNTRNVTSNTCQKTAARGNILGGVGGAFGTDASTYYGGGGGGGGPKGAGATGGNGNSGGEATDGANAGDNTGRQ